VIDLKAARSDPESFRAALARKGGVEAFDQLMESDARWLELVPQVDELRSRMKKAKGKPSPEELEELKEAKANLQRLEEELAEAEAAREAALALVPNPPHPDTPEGEGEEDAVELRRVGEPRPIANPRSHLELGRFDMERAARLSGTRFGYMIGDTALVALALYRFALDRLGEKGFVPVLPPVLVREEAMFGTGFFPTDKANIYEISFDGLYLIGTSEVALAGLHMGEVLERDELPLRYAGCSTCFRREAGAAGKETHGMFRVHQFDKVEMYVFSRPEDSWQEHERMVAIEEEIMQALELPYRAVDIAAGDLGAPAARKIDLEAWFPSQGRYREVTSCSNTTDFQARRLKIRQRSERGLEPVHTLNGTAAVGRMLLAVLENGQQEDGGVVVPEALGPFGAPKRLTR
jgi:seryl-tRNA synthetase